jgi:hypothetical protein
MSHNIKQQKCAGPVEPVEPTVPCSALGSELNPVCDTADATVGAGVPAPTATPIIDALFELSHKGPVLADMEKVAATRLSEIISIKVASQVLSVLKSWDSKHKLWALEEDKALVASSVGHLVSAPLTALEKLGDIAKGAAYNPIKRAIKKKSDSGNADDDVDGDEGGDICDEGSECDEVEVDADAEGVDAEGDVDEAGWDEDDDEDDEDDELPKKKKGVFAKIFGRFAKKNNSKK